MSECANKAPRSVRWPARHGRLLTDPGVEAAIVAFVATAPPLPEDVRARLARLLRTDRCGVEDGQSDDPDGHLQTAA
jgi:hypothetical protein